MIGPPTAHTQCSFAVYILHSAVVQENMYCILVTLHTLENKLHKCITECLYYVHVLYVQYGSMVVSMSVSICCHNHIRKILTYQLYSCWLKFLDKLVGVDELPSWPSLFDNVCTSPGDIVLS